MTTRHIFLLTALVLTPIVIWNIYSQNNLSLNAVFAFLLIVGWYDYFQVRNSILRDYPVIGHMRYILKAISPELHQYFVESNTNGAPFSKNTINLVYSRADNHEEFHPFGTERDLYKGNYTYLGHAMFPVEKLNEVPRVIVGSDKCKQPYSASLLNISAMSFGALSSNAILALNKGASLGGFYHNTGEGSLSKAHEKNGGDIVLQIGTGNFGFRNEDGTLNEDAFKEKSNLDQVKMIELKLSQGAKPGHGGVLPAKKNTEEIAKIRMVQPHTDVFSPPSNPSYDSYETMVEFIGKLRELSSYKPVGFKLSIGQKEDFITLMKMAIEKDILPDFITVDASEGGTGAAPIEYSNNIGLRGEEALVFVDETLTDLKIREKIKIIFAGKIISGVSMYKAFCRGADICNSARGFMFSLGCIQSLRCHTDTCPTGIATQNENLQVGLVPTEKGKKVEAYHRNTVDSFLEILAVTGIKDIKDLNKECLKHV